MAWLEPGIQEVFRERNKTNVDTSKEKEPSPISNAFLHNQLLKDENEALKMRLEEMAHEMEYNSVLFQLAQLKQRKKKLEKKL